MSMAATESPETTTTTRERERPAAPRADYAPPATTTGGTSGRATAALVLGILAIPTALFPILGLIVGVIGLVLGLTAKSDIRRRGLANMGHAKWGVILSSIGLVLTVVNAIAGAIIATS
jgi:uncharacterized protein DUF4190